MKRIRIDLLLALLLVPAAAGAQGIRVSGLTTARYIDVKPVTTQERIALVPITQDLSVNAWGLAPGLRFYSQLRVRAARHPAPQVAQPYSTSEPSRARKCGAIRLIVIGRLFSQAGQSTIGISRTGPGRRGIDPNKPATAADALCMVLSFLQ